jgi:hypothetical protein
MEIYLPQPMKPLSNKMNNQQLAKQIYEDMIRFWNISRLSYVLDVQKVQELDPTVTTQQLLDEFRKYPIVREAWDTRRNTITILPK